MNALILLIIALVVLAFGYRFYAKMLALWVFRLDPKYSPSIPPKAESPAATRAHRQLVFGQHIAAVSTLSTVVGCAIALTWGWIPAYLWVVIGAAIAGGVFMMGSIWMAFRNPHHNPADLGGALLGLRVRHLYYFVFLVFLLAVGSIALELLSGLLVNFPTAILPFWLLFPLALAFGSYLHHQGTERLWLATLIVIGLFYLAIIFLSYHSFAISGALNIDFQGDTLVSINNRLAWVGIILVVAFFTSQTSLLKVLRPRAYLAGVLLLVMLLLLFVAVIVVRPDLSAPSFHISTGSPSWFPWLVLIVSGGALAGYHFLFAAYYSARQIKNETDARYVGFGGAIVEALVAVSAIIVFAVGFRELVGTKTLYTNWQQFPDIVSLLRLYIHGAVQLLTGIGLSTGLARTLVAVTLGGTLYTTLETAIRMMRRMLGELAGHTNIKPFQAANTTTLLITLLLAGLVITGQLVDMRLSFWPLFGTVNVVVVIFGLLMLTLYLRRLQRPRVFIAIPLGAIVLIGNWAILAQLQSWWTAGNWLLLVCGILLFAVELWVLIATLVRPN